MKTKQQKKNPYARIEKIVALAGVALVVAGCIANLYGTYANAGFIHDPLDLVYYARYIILLGGGFIMGYLLTKKPARHQRYGQLFLGVTYAALAMAFFWLFEALRVGLQGLLGLPAYPWGKLIFIGAPLLAVVAALFVAYFSQYRPNRSDVNVFTKVTILLSFIVSEVFMLASGVYYLTTASAAYSPDASVWTIAGGYLTIPLVIAVVSYLYLNNIRKQLDRLFFATLVGVFYSALTLVLWELRMDPASDATNTFGSIVTVIALLFVGVLLWRARRAVK